MKVFLLALVAALVHGAPREPTAADPALPWLYNVDVTAITSSDDPTVALPFDLLGAIDPSCQDAPSSGLRVVGDVARSAARFRVEAPGTVRAWLTSLAQEA